MHSCFIENSPINLEVTNPSFFGWFYHTRWTGGTTNWRTSSASPPRSKWRAPSSAGHKSRSRAQTTLRPIDRMLPRNPCGRENILIIPTFSLCLTASSGQAFRTPGMLLGSLGGIQCKHHVRNLHQGVRDDLEGRSLSPKGLGPMAFKRNMCDAWFPKHF
jgi:hypothetical protein